MREKKGALRGLGWGRCACVLLLAVNRENSPEGAHNEQKEFMKTTERDGRESEGRTLDPEGLASREV